MTGTTDEIKARLNIAELVGSYVRLEKAGTHWKARCPFHQERTPSFTVNEERAMWHCFGCGKGGDVFAFVMEIEAIDFREALTMLAAKAGVTLEKYSPGIQGTEKKDHLYEILELATKFYEKQLFSAVGAKAFAYLKGRGLSEESIKRFRLGYAPEGWRHVADFLTGRGFATLEIEKAGLVLRQEHKKDFYDRFRDRIMFPVHDILGRVVGYSARVAPGGDESQAKYINTPESPVYHKSRVLYGLYLAKQAMKQAGFTIIVEGNMDVIALHQAGAENSLAVSGTALTHEQLAIIKRYGNEVRLFFDMDPAGQKAARASTMLALQNDFVVSVVGLASGKDAADLGKNDPEALKKTVEHSVPALQYFLDRLMAEHDHTSAQGKRKIVEEYTQILLAVHNPIERAHFLKLAARLLDMEEKTLSSVVNTAFLHREKKEGPTLHVAPSAERHLFGTRAERLREELIAVLYADTESRSTLFSLLEEKKETLLFLEKHPLFFFVRQAGSRDPLDLIEDKELKSQAARLVFQILATPGLSDAPLEEREKSLLALGEEYVSTLHIQVTKREKMVALEQAIRQAREKKDKALEQKLLKEFSEMTSALSTPKKV